MNYSPNSINDMQKLFLKQITYSGDDFASWYLTAEEVRRVYKTGKLPLITIKDIPEKRPKIAIILAQEKHPEREEKDYSLHPDYASTIVGAGGYPIFIAYDKVREQLNAIKPDGILLIGGCFNVPKKWYKGRLPEEDCDKRGQAYLEMIGYAKEKHLPTLGICAGEQVIAGFCSALLKKGINEGRSKEQSHKQSGEIYAHEIIIEPDSLLSSITDKKTALVNTAHNEAVCEDATGECRVIAKSPDGVVEAVQPLNPWNDFVLGVQWHPERLVKKGDEFASEIFKKFVGCCNNV